MLTKMVDGKTIVCSDEEERLLLMKWALNDKYPQYIGHLTFDGISEPNHDMTECKKRHASLLTQAYEKELKILNDQIEIAQEDGKDITPLFAQRKTLRAMVSQDLSGINTIDELVNSIPELFRKHWAIQ